MYMYIAEILEKFPWHPNVDPVYSITIYIYIRFKMRINYTHQYSKPTEVKVWLKKYRDQHVQVHRMLA